MALLQTAEQTVGDLFKGAPKLAESTKETIAKVWPWLALIGGLLQLLGALSLYRWASATSEFTNYVNDIYGTNVIAERWTVWIWAGLAFMAVEAVLLLLAFPKLKNRQKSGWDLLFLVALLNVVYAVVSVFMDYGGGVFGLFWNLVVSAVVMWLLFATRDKFKSA